MLRKCDSFIIKQLFCYSVTSKMQSLVCDIIQRQLKKPQILPLNQDPEESPRWSVIPFPWQQARNQKMGRCRVLGHEGVLACTGTG